MAEDGEARRLKRRSYLRSYDRRRMVEIDPGSFVNVVRRYGADAAGVTALIEAAQQSPTIAAADIGFACGNCAK